MTGTFTARTLTGLIGTEIGSTATIAGKSAIAILTTITLTGLVVTGGGDTGRNIGINTVGNTIRGRGGSGSTAGGRGGAGTATTVTATAIFTATIVTMTDTIGTTAKGGVAHKVTHVVTPHRLTGGLNGSGRGSGSDTSALIRALPIRSGDVFGNGTRGLRKVFTIL